MSWKIGGKERRPDVKVRAASCGTMSAIIREMV